MLQNGKMLSNYLIWRRNIVSYEISEETMINKPKFQSFKAFLPDSPTGGGVGYAISEMVQMKASERKKYKVVKTTTKPGRRLKLKYLDSESQETKEIHINVVSSGAHHGFFEQYWAKEVVIKDSRCYIATTCYEDVNAKEVVILRAFRDKVLNQTFWGRTFIKLYYKISPHMVRLFSDNKTIKRIIRNLLNRIIHFIN